MTVQAGGAVLVLAAAVLGLWRYGVQRRQRRTLVWALAAAIGEMESAIRWQQTPMMALLEGLAAREKVGQYFHETADMVQGGMPLQCAWEKAFSAIQDGEAGEILARLRLGGDRERLVGALGQTRQELEELYRRRCREDGQRSRVTTAAALCGFDSVQEVTFLFDGQKRSQLTHGTDVSGVFKADGVNLESVETTANLTNASRVQLYFPSADGRLMVPVTRTVFSPADLTTAMLELAKGPEKDSGLEIPLPKDCGLRSVTLKNGVATIDFTKEFASLATAEDASAATSQALRAIVFTASQFPGVKKVEVLVEGKPFEAQPSAVTTFVNQADEVMAQYPGLITVD